MFKVQNDYALALLQLMAKIRRGTVRQILAEFERQYRDQIPNERYEENSDGTPKWETTVRFARADWVRFGMFTNAPHGYWEISEEGLHWLDEHPNDKDATLAIRTLARENLFDSQKRLRSELPKRTQRTSRATLEKNTSQETKPHQRPHQLLDQKIHEIESFLAGRALRKPSDEELCDCVQLCYFFELHQEGLQLFAFIQPETLNNDWLYRRTKRYADLCRIKAKT